MNTAVGIAATGGIDTSGLLFAPFRSLVDSLFMGLSLRVVPGNSKNLKGIRRAGA
jgi:hypothetical protein